MCVRPVCVSLVYDLCVGPLCLPIRVWLSVCVCPVCVCVLCVSSVCVPFARGGVLVGQGVFGVCVCVCIPCVVSCVCCVLCVCVCVCPYTRVVECWWGRAWLEGPGVLGAGTGG